MSSLLNPNGVLVEIAKTDTATGTPVGNAMASRAAESLQEALKQMSSFIDTVCDNVRSAADAKGVTEAEVAFGLSFTSEGNVYVVKGSAEVSLEVTLKIDCTRRL